MNRVFEPYLIVYKKSKIRFYNYLYLNEIIFKKKLNRFDAIDTINDYMRWRMWALDNNMVSNEYIIQNCDFKKGKLGCNLSHQLLLMNIEYDYGDNNQVKWFLIMEDDIGIEVGNFVDINNFVEDVIVNVEKHSKKTKYIQMCIYNQFIEEQKKAKCICSTGNYDLRKKINQYGTCCYLIHIDAVRYLNQLRPWNVNIDFLYNQLDNNFQSIACVNNVFYSRGIEHKFDNREEKKAFSSLIWGE